MFWKKEIPVAIHAAVYTDAGGRPDNEDSVRTAGRPGRLLTVVADGLGGHGGGAQASSTAAELICGQWSGMISPAVLIDLVQAAHKKVLSLQTPLCALKTTVVVLAVENGRAAWAHAGDSRLYHFHNGRLVFQTRDHSASQIAVMLGDITPDQIRFHEDRNKVLRALGQAGSLRVDAREEELAPGRHAWLLCTDGFWEYVLEDEMQSDLAAASGPKEWLERMKVRLIQRIPSDNDNNTACAVWMDQKSC